MEEFVTASAGAPVVKTASITGQRQVQKMGAVKNWDISGENRRRNNLWKICL